MGDSISILFVCENRLSLDAFTRCWVQETSLLNTIAPLLPLEKQTAFGELRTAWKAKNIDLFQQSMKTLARQLLNSLTDEYELSDKSLWKSLVWQRAAKHKELEKLVNN